MDISNISAFVSLQLNSLALSQENFNFTQIYNGLNVSLKVYCLNI